MTAEGYALLFGLSLNAAAIIYTARVIMDSTSKLDRVINDVQKVEIATNSMKDELVKATRKAALLQGDKEGRADLKAEQAIDESPRGGMKRSTTVVDEPVPVADDRVAAATERIADAAEMGTGRKP